MDKLPESPKDVAKDYWSKRFALQEEMARRLLIAIMENVRFECPELSEMEYAISRARKYCWIAKLTPDISEIQESIESIIPECYDDLIEVLYEPARYDSATVKRDESGGFEVTLTR